MTRFLFVAAALGAGIASALQAAANAGLTQRRLVTALVVNAAGTLAGAAASMLMAANGSPARAWSSLACSCCAGSWLQPRHRDVSC